MVPEPPRIPLQKGNPIENGTQYHATYTNFTETGQYRIVIYATDDERLISHPKEITLQIGGEQQLYLPMVIR